jgi:hypothetical protein
VIEEAVGEMKIKPVPVDVGCFVAGTLVHTREGLVPIERIKVGDRIWSQPEGDPKGERAYKRVTKTFFHDDREVWSVDCSTRSKAETLIVTADHPIYVHGQGWTRADRRYTTRGPSLLDGTSSTVSNLSPITRTPTPDVGWVQSGYGVEDKDDPYGRLLDLRNQSIRIDYDRKKRVTNEAFEATRQNRFKARVYNLEVEDFHTYYVGELGVWVHDNKQFAGDLEA